MIGQLLETLEKDVVQAAQDLLGWQIVIGSMRARIVETEAYRTPDDPACHAHRGITKRNEVMFGERGRAYVYFTYGNHWMLNVTAMPLGMAGAVLIRAAEPLEGLELMRARRARARRDEDLLSGPGKLCQGLGVDIRFNGEDLLGAASQIGLEPGPPPAQILRGTRIGLTQGLELPWRFADGDRLRWVSKPISTLGRLT